MPKGSNIQTGPGGGIIASGRTPKALQLKNYGKILNLLDDCAEDALKVLIDGLDDENPWVRVRCAETILKKYIPDKKIKEMTGPGGGPIEVTNIDNRTAILNVINLLDEIDMDELKQRAENGSIRLLETNREPETETEAEVGKEETEN